MNAGDMVLRALYALGAKMDGNRFKNRAGIPASKSLDIVILCSSRSVGIFYQMSGMKDGLSNIGLSGP